MESVAVVVGTYGDRKWVDLANERAIPSIEAQTVRPDEIVIVHGESLQAARNLGAAECRADHLIFLDADDELDSRYIEAMTAGTGDLRQPSTLGIVDGVEDDFAVLIPKKNLLEANFLVIGTMIRRSYFESTGGFDDYPILEDWALWLKAWKAGAEISAVPDAIYRVHVNTKGRNNSDPALHGRTYQQIRALYHG